MSTQQYVLDRSGGVPALDGARLLYVTSAQYSAEWASAEHTHTCAELFFVTAGSGAMQIGQVPHPLTAGDLMAVSGAVPHTEISAPEDPMEYVVLGVDGLETLAGADGFALVPGFYHQRQVAQCLDMLLLEAQRAQTGYEGVCQDLMHILLLLLVRHRGSILQSAPREQKASRECSLVRRYIDDHFKENITLDQLAAAAHLNKYYLAHAFQKEYGVSPIRYLTARRIRESKFLLAETDHSLSHIAQVLGFSSASYFSQCFRRVEGVSPKEYRQHSRNNDHSEVDT